ncbi:wiskott-Aldrich syndrome protein family member 3-like isoform X1 [Acipenser oxyrinchus oxyrinchus]|uniref:Wiskott-Aldrich syndrome protein family member n=1 Tax=Acipenser oxyrinchus oxyrinchus TaxID=40147 RepID=A0AAD8D6U0_ACIOX|nr:wiskott-Aldrich syndrome protein family member 3-like isoform X1 [Acipenser oxyrinchus oxyrinchus]
MPLVKRNIEPRHLCRGALPNGVTSELECVTNSTLAAIIKQLGSLSRHAEDIFGELFNEANSFCMRMNNLQDRVDLLAVKVTQLDSTVEEVSLQDINMRKAFKSSTVQDQQVVSRASIPNPVMEIYQHCDKPPPLNILSPYRDDKKDGLKFYTDPSYFFNLWKEKMLQATEDKRKEKRRQKTGSQPTAEQVRPKSRLSQLQPGSQPTATPSRSTLYSPEQKQVEDPSREVRKVRKARNRRDVWNLMAYDKEFRPDNRFSPSPYHAVSSEGSLSPDNRSAASDAEHSYPASPNHPSQQVSASSSYSTGDSKELLAAPVQTQSLDRAYRGPATTAGRQSSLGRVQQPHVPLPSDSALNGPRPLTAKDYSAKQIPEYFVPPAPPPPPPVIPSAQTAFDSPAAPRPSPQYCHCDVSTVLPSPPAPYLFPSSPPQPLLVALLWPLLLPTRPPTHPPATAHTASPSAAQDSRKSQVPLVPMSDARSDLLAAIRRGIQLRKVQEQREQEAKKEPVANDVATILSRRIAVEYSESDDDSELDENEWSD